MFKKILVPLDGSELAEQILRHVQVLARDTDAEIILLRVPIYAYAATVTTPAVYGYTPLPLPLERDAALKEARNYLNKMRNVLVPHGLHVSVVVREGDPAEAIIRFAHEADIDLIAMSTHGRTGLSRALFGSVAEQVVRGAGKPVLLIRAGS